MKPKQKGDTAISLDNFLLSHTTLYFPSSISPISPFWPLSPRQNLDKYNFEVRDQLQPTDTV